MRSALAVWAGGVGRQDRHQPGQGLGGGVTVDAGKLGAPPVGDGTAARRGPRGLEGQAQGLVGRAKTG